MIIAIDGPAASGKGTLAKRLAAHFGLRHLDTGLLYRAVAKSLLDAGAALEDEARAVAAAQSLDASRLNEAALKARGMADPASIVSTMPGVRTALVELQRQFAGAPPGAVLDGRDIGTVVCPEADVKLYVTASAEVRARRRLAEIEGNHGSADYATILADIERRDERDTSRADSPLRPAADAHLLDTSEMDIEAAFLAARAIIDAALAARDKALHSG
jgi:CMP/dCMP kinase